MNLLEQIREAAASIAEMSAEQLKAFTDLINKAWSEYEKAEATPEIADVINELVDYSEKALARQSEIEAAIQKAEADKERARQVIGKLNGEADGAPEGGTGEAATGEAEGAPEGETEGVPVGIAASGKVPTAASLRSTRGRTVLRQIAPDAVRPSLVAAGNVGGKSNREPFESREDLAVTIAETLRGLPRDAANGRVLVASARWLDQYDESRRLRAGEQVSNELKMDAVVSLPALAASGGIPLPVNVDYSLDAWTNADRPIRDFLVPFGADHGGLTFRQPGSVGDLSGANTVWTEATDANPGASVKAVYTVPVPATVTEYVDAVSTRLQFGNMMGQFDPALIANQTELSLAAAARTAELNLQNRLAARATAITSAQVLGASRDMLTTIRQIASAFRWTNRIDPGVRLAIMLPEFVKDMIRNDRAMELAHDGSSPDPLAIPDQWIEDAIALSGVRVCWFSDGLPANTTTLPNYAAQTFAAFAGDGGVPAWPANIVWYVFVDGSVQFLDGGRLDLGVVRDATLDAKNDYETFVETFEGIAFRGFNLGALQVVSTLLVNGESSATKTV